MEPNVTTEQDRDYGSRKFIVTLLVILCTTVLAAYGKMDQNVAFVFAAGISTYNWAADRLKASLNQQNTRSW